MKERTLLQLLPLFQKQLKIYQEYTLLSLDQAKGSDIVCNITRSQIEIAPDKNLFNRWRQIGSRISACASIVQNNMVVQYSEVAEWRDLVAKLMDDLRLLEQETLRYIGISDQEVDIQKRKEGS